MPLAPLPPQASTSIVPPHILLSAPFASVSDLLESLATHRGASPAMQSGSTHWSFTDLNDRVDRIAAALQRDGVRAGAVVALCASSSLNYFAAFFAITRIGAVAAPLPTGAAPGDLLNMLADSGASIAFLDKNGDRRLREGASSLPVPGIYLDDSHSFSFEAWMAPSGSRPTSVAIKPDHPFNIIYSSGTTGTPKGIVQSHQMRWQNAKYGPIYRFDTKSIALVCTPPYSNLTLGHVLYALGGGGCAVIMPKFDAREFLVLAARAKASHTFMVPVQYRRILDVPDFSDFDLSHFRIKIMGGAPADAAFKAELIARWPGELVELYGMTEGGGRCLLFTKEHAGKLHTVGRPMAGHDIRILGDDGKEVAQGETGEIVGRSEVMMNGYHNRPDLTRDTEWYDDAGRRFIRMGDVGAFDEDGFLILKDRKKDMLISGGANIYPSDIEMVLRRHPAVAEAAVVGVPSRAWGETPVAFVVLRDGEAHAADEIKVWANSHLGAIQRLSGLEILNVMPRSAIDKILKRELQDRARERFAALA